MRQNILANDANRYNYLQILIQASCSTIEIVTASLSNLHLPLWGRRILPRKVKPQTLPGKVTKVIIQIPSKYFCPPNARICREIFPARPSIYEDGFLTEKRMGLGSTAAIRAASNRVSFAADFP